jgi:hypothetical protein
MDTPSDSPSRWGTVPGGDAPLQDQLAVAQFNALRAELVSLRENMIKLGLWSIAVFPTLMTLVSGRKLGAKSTPTGKEPATEMVTNLGQDLESLLICGSPIMVSFCALLFCSLHCSVMRIGGFIKDQIESKMMTHGGWEHFLEGQGRRLPEKCFLAVMMGFYLTYFSVAFMIARNSAPEQLRFAFCVVYWAVLSVTIIACLVAFRFRAKNASSDQTARLARTVALSIARSGLKARRTGQASINPAAS